MNGEVVGTVEAQGVARLDGVVDGREIRSAVAALEAEGRGSGNLRQAAAVSPALARLAAHPGLRALAEALLGPGARLVRSTLFDKTPSANWKVAWHQDLTVEVEARHEVPGYGPWSVKGGVPCVQPPDAVLDAMVTLRVRLDDCGVDDGPIRVLPGTHRGGRIAEASIPEVVAGRDGVSCEGAAGSVLVMKPLLLHASSPARVPSRRRVLHLDFAGVELPAPLAWREASVPASSRGP